MLISKGYKFWTTIDSLSLLHGLVNSDASTESTRKSQVHHKNVNRDNENTSSFRPLYLICTLSRL